MSRYKCIVSYDGSNYHGWQSQRNHLTVQETINNVIDKLHGHHVKIMASGRTDQHVHALGQVFHFDSELKIPEGQWINAINHLLPKDIRIIDVKIVTSDFHARYSANKKRYDYFLNTNAYDLFQCDHIFQLSQKIDLKLVKEASSIFLGEHDFSSFCSNNFTDTPNQVRIIEKIDIEELNGIIHFILIGNGFMRYMVRMIVGTLIEVGKGKLTKSAVLTMLEAKSKTACRYKAKPEGLYLVEVFYDD